MPRLFIFCLAACSLLSCEKPLEITFDTNPSKLVVISNFTAEQDLLVRVTNSQPVIGNTEPAFIFDAEVELFENDVFQQSLTLVDQGTNSYYTTRHLRPRPGQIYTIKVSAPGFQSVEGKSKIPEQIVIQDLDISNVAVSTEQRSDLSVISYDLNMRFEDPEGERNFYHLHIYQAFQEFSVSDTDTLFKRTSRRPVVFNTINTSNLQVVHYDGSILFEDLLFDGGMQQLNIPVNLQYDPSSEKLGHVIVELRSVTEEYYLFHTSLSRQQFAPSQPYVDPVILYNNIKNGHGIFAGYSSSTSSVEVR